MSEVFKGINRIQYEGPESKNPMAYKHYNPAEMVGDRTMADHLRLRRTGTRSPAKAWILRRGHHVPPWISRAIRWIRLKSG